MYLLDTNVLSELMRAVPSQAVLNWINGQKANDLFISAITRAEIELGIALLPAGKRRTNLATQAKAMFVEDFAGRCLPFDEKGASLYAALVASRTRQGLPISVEDAQIAAIGLCHRKTLVTRNTTDFENIQELSLLNPW
jgi:toxin FitB